jgi:membrane protease YdiL (CAAX protease family)
MSDRTLEVPFRVLRWDPRWGDLAPIGLWIILSAVLQFSRLAGPLAPVILEWLKPLADLGFLLVPLLFVRLISREGLDFLGVTRRRIVAAVIVGVIIGAFTGWLAVWRSLAAGEIPFLPAPLDSVAYLLGALYHLVAVEFFYRGWLASRLEQSYGFLAAVFGSALLYAFSPLILWGTDPTVPAAYTSLGFYWGAVFPFTFFMGILLAGVARLTRNLLAPVLIMLPQTILGDFLPGGAAHRISHSESTLVGTLALAGIVVVVVWLTRKAKRNLQATG